MILEQLRGLGVAKLNELKKSPELTGTFTKKFKISYIKYPRLKSRRNCSEGAKQTHRRITQRFYIARSVE